MDPGHAGFTVQFEAQFHNPSANTNIIVELEIILHEKSVVKYKVSFLTWGAGDNLFFLHHFQPLIPETV